MKIFLNCENTSEICIAFLSSKKCVKVVMGYKEGIPRFVKERKIVMNS